jgi:hypothetical protein
MRLTSAWTLIPCMAFLAELFLSLGTWSTACAQPIVHPYRTAQAIALQTALSAEWSIPIVRQPLLELAQEWSLVGGIPVWLDRRIATDRLITLSDPKPTIGEVMVQVATSIGAEVAMIDRMVLIVPQGRSECIEQAYWSLAVADPGNWMRVVKIVADWDEGADAQQILTEFAQRYDLAGELGGRVEHDLWRAWRWQPTTPAAVGLCLLSGFDLQLELDDDPLRGGQVRVGPMRHSLPAMDVAWEYRDEIQKIGRDAWQRWREAWPDAQVEKLGQGGSSTRWRITAQVRAHRELVAPLAPRPKKSPSSAANLANSRFTGRYRGELHLILKSMANQMNLELKMDELSPQVLRQELDLPFENATVDEIVKKIAFGSGLDVRLEGGRLIVRSQ